MHVLGLFGRRRLAGPDRPDRLVGNDGRGKCRYAVTFDRRCELLVDHLLGAVGFAFLERLADAENRHQPAAERRGHFFRDLGAALSVQRAPFRVADDRVSAAHVMQHRR